ncbi:hypothetical protein Bca52824_044206 [Brassica carinata]|uniref:Uncharacterized protein n=1 Tax=Brassica carinata TaxID=52824 RepID=A0A8X7S0R0_BRACI|nr:hypothetical protein Bca52824_044206 [Brassica carinata]
MGLLDHLWDDTVAGPRPENGLGKLRRHHTFSFRASSGNDQSDGGSVRSYGGDSPEEAVKVTRSIMIIKPPGYQGGSAPVSPAGSTPPVSPFSVEEACRDYDVDNVIDMRSFILNHTIFFNNIEFSPADHSTERSIIKHLLP